MTYGSFSFLFMGDAEGKDRDEPATTKKYVEKKLIDNIAADKLRATVLKAGHHGSETSSTTDFVKAVKPKVVVMMSGRKSFGQNHRFLPDQTVIDRYETLVPDVVVLRTDFLDEQEGRDEDNDADGDDVFMFTDGHQLRVYQSRLNAAGQREWVRVKIIDSST